jgi:hypothetical protein
VNRVTSFFKQLRLGRILTVCFAILVMFVGTACNNGTTTGARPGNLPVQMGGNNNPHTKGGDGYTQYKMSEDPTVNYRNEVNQTERVNKQAGLVNFDRLVAVTPQADESKLLYPGSNASSTNNPNFGTLDQSNAKELRTPQIPAPRQNVIDRSDPNVGILEKAGEAFKDASSFLKDTSDEALQTPEMQPNPGAARR